MTCPKCKNPNAECIIGNFYKCPSCDGTPRASSTKPSGIFDRVITALQIWPQRKVEDYVQGHQNAHLPPVVGQIPMNEVRNASFAWWRLELEHIYLTKYAHDPRQFVDYIDGCVQKFLNDLAWDLANRMVPRPSGIEVFEGFPHWVTDDGQIMIRVCADSDALELRMRAIWRPT